MTRKEMLDLDIVRKRAKVKKLVRRAKLMRDVDTKRAMAYAYEASGLSREVRGMEHARSIAAL